MEGHSFSEGSKTSRRQWLPRKPKLWSAEMQDQIPIFDFTEVCGLISQKGIQESFLEGGGGAPDPHKLPVGCLGEKLETLSQKNLKIKVPNTRSLGIWEQNLGI